MALNLISDIVQKTLSKVARNVYNSFADEGIEPLYVIHIEEEFPTYGKAGLMYFTATSTVIVVDTLPENVQNVMEDIRVAMEGMESEGDVKVYGCRMADSSRQTNYSEEDRLWYCSAEYEIEYSLT